MKKLLLLTTVILFGFTSGVWAQSEDVARQLKQRYPGLTKDDISAIYDFQQSHPDMTRDDLQGVAEFVEKRPGMGREQLSQLNRFIETHDLTKHDVQDMFDTANAHGLSANDVGQIQQYRKNHPGVSNKQAFEAYKLHQKYPNASKEDIVAAVKNPNKGKAAAKLHEKYPNASRNEIRQAVNHPYKGRAADKIHNQHPDASKKQVQRAVKTQEKRAHFVHDKYPNAKKSDKKAFMTNPRKGQRANRLYDADERNGWGLDRDKAGKIVNNPKKAHKAKSNRPSTKARPRYNN